MDGTGYVPGMGVAVLAGLAVGGDVAGLGGWMVTLVPWGLAWPGGPGTSGELG